MLAINYKNRIAQPIISSLYNNVSKCITTNITNTKFARHDNTIPLTYTIIHHQTRYYSQSSPYNHYTYNSNGPYNRQDWHATTILSVRKGNDVVVIGDGQVSIGASVVKDNARKVRIIGNNKVITGFAGASADCFALLDRLEKKLDEHPNQLLRACVEMAKEWRTDKFLRMLYQLCIYYINECWFILFGC